MPASEDREARAPGMETSETEETRARAYASKENSPTPPDHVRTKAPGRVCLIGEHTDYNEGLALAFAIAESVTVEAKRLQPDEDGEETVRALAIDFGEEDEFALTAPPAATGWRAFVRGMAAELAKAGLRPVGASLQIEGGVPRGAGLSSSAALEVALALAMLALAGTGNEIGKTDLARLCSRVENEWAGARTGLLDQLTSLYGEPEEALRIDFRDVSVERVPLHLKGWRLVTYDTGERRENANSGYNERRWECAEACRLLGVSSLREASPEQVERLPEPLRGRAVHVLGDNERVEARGESPPGRGHAGFGGVAERVARELAREHGDLDTDGRDGGSHDARSRRRGRAHPGRRLRRQRLGIAARGRGRAVRRARGQAVWRRQDLVRHCPPAARGAQPRAGPKPVASL